MMSMLAVALAGTFAGPVASAPKPWTPPSPAFYADSRPLGALAARLERSLARLDKPPFTLPFILADVSFSQKRIFTEYSGDISGRVLGVSATEARCGRRPRWPVKELLTELGRYQKPDGHFGIEQDLKKIVGERDMPILWGNGRLLIGLVEAYDATHEPLALALARKLGDYYVDTDPLLDKAELVDRFGNYAAGFATCYFSGLEGLVGLSRVTKDRRYLEQAERMAKLMAGATTAKEQHSHGRLCALRGLLDLFEATSNRHYLDRVIAEHNIWVRQFVWPTGGISEMSTPTFSRNEGCTEADWLRLNLQLWRLTGRDSFLDLAEMTLTNELAADQFANGGFGHRVALIQNASMDGYLPGTCQGTQEAYWCCSEHGPRALLDVASNVVLANGRDVYINLYEPSEAAITAGAHPVRMDIAPSALGERVTITIHTPKPERLSFRLRIPSWCRELRVDGKPVQRVSEGRAAVQRTWRDGDKIELQMAFAVYSRLDGNTPQVSPARRDIVSGASVYYGPHLLVFTGDPSMPAQPTLSLIDAEKALAAGEEASAHTKERATVRVQPLAKLPAEAGFRCRLTVTSAK